MDERTNARTENRDAKLSDCQHEYGVANHQPKAWMNSNYFSTGV